MKFSREVCIFPKAFHRANRVHYGQLENREWVDFLVVIMASGIARESRNMAAILQIIGLPCTSLILDIHVMINCICIYAHHPIRVIHTKITDEYKKLVEKTKFSLREDLREESRSLSSTLPIVTLGSPLYIPVPSLNFYFITDIRCESPPG